MKFQMTRKYIPTTLEQVMKVCIDNKGAEVEIEKDGDKITYFALLTPRYDLLPYWVKERLSNGWDNGLSQFYYTNSASRIVFTLHENTISTIDALAGIEKPNVEKYYTSAVHGFYYDYDTVNDLLSKLDYSKILKKKVNHLKIGSFLAEYYNGIKNGITGIYRIGEKCNYSYTIFNILNETETNDSFPSSIDFSCIGENDKYCMLPISYNEVKKLIVKREKKELVDYLMSIPHSIGGIEKGKEQEHWETTQPHKLITTYHNWLKSNKAKFEIVRLFENDIKTYEPIGDFKFSGHKFKQLEIND